MASTLAKFSGTRSTSSTAIPNRSSTKTTSLSRLSESRTPVSSSDVVVRERQQGRVLDEFPADVVVDDRFQCSRLQCACAAPSLSPPTRAPGKPGPVDLAGGGPGQRLAELHHVRHHVARQPPTAVVEYFLTGEAARCHRG